MLQVTMTTRSRHELQEADNGIYSCWEYGDEEVHSEEQPLPYSRDDICGTCPSVLEALGHNVGSPKQIQLYKENCHRTQGEGATS